MHGHSDDDGSVDDWEDEIAVFKGFMAGLWIAVEEETNVVGLRQVEGDFIVVVIIVNGRRTIEWDGDGSSIIADGGARIIVGSLLDIGIGTIECGKPWICKHKGITKSIVYDIEVAATAISLLVVDGIIIDGVELPIWKYRNLSHVFYHHRVDNRKLKLRMYCEESGEDNHQ
jgi:hypothetical protein